MSRATHILLPILTVAAAAFSATRTDLKVGTRTAIVYTPSGYSNPPLVISMHGMGFGAGTMQGMIKFETYADTSKERFITVYPQGESNMWDLGSMKDVNFITAIIDSMYNRYKIDRNRVYASGFSMGGMMSWYLSCKIPDKIAAIAPGNGFPLGGLSGCSETRHVPVLHMHGNADDFVKYTDFAGTFLPAQLTRYGCPTKVTTKPYPVDKPTSGSYKDYYGPCVKNGLKSEITFITVDGMIHDWATLGKANTNSDTKYKGKMFDIDGTYEAWNWLKTQSLTGTTTPTTPVAPVIKITTPLSTGSFTAPATVTVDATASDADGTVSHIDFYDGTTLVHSEWAAPYGWEWTGVTAGTHVLKAVATDNDGNTARDSVTITVKSGTLGIVQSANREVVVHQVYDLQGNRIGSVVTDGGLSLEHAVGRLTRRAGLYVTRRETAEGVVARKVEVP